MLDGPGPAARRRNWLVVGVLVAVVVIAVVVAAFPPPSSSSGSGGTLGPYSLSQAIGNLSMPLAFPQCSVVTVQWTLQGSGNATFAVWTPISSHPSTCTAPPPTENITCPPRGCPTPVVDQLVCIEDGTGGTCAFLATQTSYTFVNYVPYDSTVWTSVSFTASYS
jgi:hypothetical protein